MGITQPNKLKDKEQELSQKLRDAEAELNNKRKELEQAGNENKEKSALIEEHKNTIKALQESVENYEQQIASINAELATLRANFDSNKEPANPQPSVEQTNNTQDSTNENISTTNPETTQDNIDIHTPAGFLAVLNKLLEEIEDTNNEISKKGLSKAGKETMKLAKAKLKQYKNTIKAKKEKLEKAIKKGTTPQIYETDVQQAINLKSDIDTVRQDVSLGQRGELSNLGSFLYNSPENAKKSNNYQANDLEFNQKFQNELKQGAILNIFNKNTQQANDFFRRIAQGEYTQADYQLFVTNAAILKPCCQRYGINVPTNPMGSGGRIETVQGAPRSSVDYSNMDFGEAFQQGGIVGLIDKGLSSCKNMTPGQRNTWKSIAVLGGYAAGIYGLFKFFTNKNMGFWGKALTTGGVILGSQMLTGENPLSLFQRLLTGGFTKEYLEDKFGNAFGDAVDGVQNSGIEGANNLSGAMYSLMIFNDKTKVGEIRQLASKFRDHQQWTQFRGKAKAKLGEKYFEKFSAVFSENFDENKWNEWLKTIGINDGIDDNQLIYEIAGYKAINTITINKFLSDNGVKVTDNKAKKAEYEQYIQSCNNNNTTIDESILESHKNDGSWFKEDLKATYTDRKIDGENIKKLEDQVEALSTDFQKKTELKTAVKRFYDERTIESKPNPDKFNLKMEGDFLILTSHGGYETKINLNNKSLDGFGSGDGITFTNLSDLLNAADLTNKILESQKGKAAVDTPIFKYIPGLGIYFNTAKGVRNDLISLKWSGTDTRVLSSGLWGASKKITEIDDKLEDYAAYLSKRREEVNNISI